MKPKISNTLKCDVCGRFIKWADIIDRKARNDFVVPDNAFGGEQYERTCATCLAKEKSSSRGLLGTGSLDQAKK